MNRVLTGVLLVLAATLAQADDTDNSLSHEIKFAFKERGSFSSLLGDAGPNALMPPFMAPAHAHGDEAGYLLLDYRREQAWELRDQLFDSLGMAKLVPQGQFLAGGVATRWHFSVPNTDTFEFKFSARF